MKSLMLHSRLHCSCFIPFQIDNVTSDCIPNILWICSHVFELGDLQFLGSTQIFTPYGGFPLIALLPGMLNYLLFQGLKDHILLDVCVKFFA